jgi:hypothetical protein
MIIFAGRHRQPAFACNSAIGDLEAGEKMVEVFTIEGVDISFVKLHELLGDFDCGGHPVLFLSINPEFPF